MKRIIVIIFFLTALVSSCVRYGEIPNPIAGMWAVVDMDGLTSQYLLFENGQIHVYSSGSKKFHVFKDSICGTSEGDFSLMESHRYSIVDGKLHCADNPIDISVGADIMILGNETLHRIYRFDPVLYNPTINITSVSNSSYTTIGGSGRIDYVIENPLYGGTMSLSHPGWIEIVEFTDTSIMFDVLPLSSNVSREDVIVLSYPSADDVEVTIVQNPDNISYLSLSSSGRANCYIVSGQGAYKFDAVQGNSSTSVGKISSAEVLWESFGTSVTTLVGDLIKSVSYVDGSITFQTADAFNEGNAVIAAKDASGTILWSWHIWLTDQPQAQIYNNNAGTMMDRNLGATSATPGDVGALGLLYQWGRKDPFLGSSSISSNAMAKSTITWPSAVLSDSSNGTIEYATSHPTTFITRNTSNYDWYYTGSSSTDDPRWTTSDQVKSIYDPCPSGWRVPDGGFDGVWEKAGFGATTYDSVNKGISFIISSPSKTWYPASGRRYYYDGSLCNVGDRGYCWSASPNSNNACHLYFNSNGSVNPSYYGYRAYGYSVRCLQESK